MSANLDDNKRNLKNGKLLEGFLKPGYGIWREAAEKTLKGASFEKKLLSRIPEGITLQPIYDADALVSCAALDTLPGEVPFLRTTKSPKTFSNAWKIAQKTYASDLKALNAVFKEELSSDGTALSILLDPTDDRAVSLSELADFEQAFDGIDLTSRPLVVFAGESSQAFISLLTQYLGGDEKTSRLHGCAGSDPISVAAVNGRLKRNRDKLYDEMAVLALWASEKTNGLRTVFVQGECYHNAGATAVQELAFAIAAGVEHLRAMIDRGVLADIAAMSVSFNFSVGSVFFTEVAKLRAARVLWSKIVDAFGGAADAQKMVVHAATSKWNQTRLDPYVNMVRATAEVFCAAVGGVDSMHVDPFDDAFKKSDVFSRRIARNTQRVLLEESHMGHVIDPAGGSYYVESLTDEIAAAAWSLFQEVERRGGMFKALEDGFVSDEISGVSKRRRADLAVRRAVVVGSNKFVDSTAQLPVEKPERYAEGKDVSMLGESFTPLKMWRAATMFEELRERTYDFFKRTGVRPRVFIAGLGTLAKHKPISDFVRSFFDVGGFEVVNGDGLSTPEVAADAAIEVKPDFAVLCSADYSYLELIPAFIERLRQNNSKIILLLAGHPGEQEETYRKHGVYDFVHVRADVHSLLNDLMDKMGEIS